MSDGDYYQYQKRWDKPFAALSKAARRRMLDCFYDRMQPTETDSILDVGVTSNTRDDSNFFEKHYRYPDRVVCAGFEPADELTGTLGDFPYVQIGPDTLPFADQSFDIGVSFAVIEHVGSRSNQHRHLSELMRVCRRVFITTPNRWFPIEPHTMLPIVHYLPLATWRRALPLLGRSFYSSEEKLNPLDRRGLRSLFPERSDVRIEGIGLVGPSTNLVAMASKS